MATEQNESESILNLAEMYYNCDVANVDPVNVKHAVDLFVSLAEGTYDKKIKRLAAYRLWQIWSSNKNPEGKHHAGEAFKYLEIAANFGYAEAEKDLGNAFLTGVLGHQIRVASAIKWLSKAANEGNQEANAQLQQIYTSSSDSEDSLQGELKTSDLPQPGTQRHAALLQQYETLGRDAGKSIMDGMENIFSPMVVQSVDSEIYSKICVACPTSPTAQRYWRAWESYRKGVGIWQSGSASITKEQFLDGLKHYTDGLLCVSSLSIYFPAHIPVQMVETTFNIPHKFFMDFFRIMLESSISDKYQSPDGMHNVVIIRKYEQLSFELQQYCSHSDVDDRVKKLHGCVYYMLGGLYCITEQRFRSTEAFEKSYDLFSYTTEYDSLFAIGYQYNYAALEQKQFQESIETLFSKGKQEIPCPYEKTHAELMNISREWLARYLEKAPKCDRKRPDANFLLAEGYLYYDKNNKKFAYFFEKGLEAEENRLPFLPPVDQPTKNGLQLVYNCIRENYCSYPECPHETLVPLKRCTACKAVAYCGRKCQNVYWKVHKRICKKKIKSK